MNAKAWQRYDELKSEWLAARDRNAPKDVVDRLADWVLWAYRKALSL